MEFTIKNTETVYKSFVITLKWHDTYFSAFEDNIDITRQINCQKGGWNEGSLLIRITKYVLIEKKLTRLLCINAIQKRVTTNSLKSQCSTFIKS